MEISFESKRIRALCEDEDLGETEFGEIVSTNLKSRLSDIRASKSVKNLPNIGNPCEIEGNQHPYFRIELANGFCLEFCPNHISNPYLDNGKIDWTRVKNIKILRIEKML